MSEAKINQNQEVEEDSNEAAVRRQAAAAGLHATDARTKRCHRAAPR